MISSPTLGLVWSELRSHVIHGLWAYSVPFHLWLLTKGNSKKLYVLEISWISLANNSTGASHVWYWGFWCLQFLWGVLSAQMRKVL